MKSADVVNGDDEQFTHLLACYSEALLAGGDADPAGDSALSAELQQRLQRDLACVRRLLRFRPQHPRTEAVTLLMENSITLHDGFVGKQMGRFHIRRPLGHGGGGIVFLAFDPDLRREVALKIPHLPALLAPDMGRRFLREARAAAQLDHPNLVPVYEVAESNGVCFLVSAYCRGGSLAQWLAARTQPVPVRQVADWLAALADAVQYVHACGIYHRDIKPGNILLDMQRARSVSDGQASVAYASGSMEQFTPRLSDFGLAKLHDAQTEATRSGAVLGTVSYMSPEQVEGRLHDIGPATDVYGLGAVLYEMLTGRPPFRGATDTDTLRQVLGNEPVPPQRLRREVPPDLQTICLKCLEKEPARRYASASELAADLRRFLAGQPIGARPPSGADRVRKWMRRKPWVTAFGSILGAVVLSLMLGGLWLHETKRNHDAKVEAVAKQHEEREETIRRREQRLLQFHYAEDIALAGQHESKRRLDELADKLQAYRGPFGAEDPRGFEWYYLSEQAGILRRRMRFPNSALYCVAFSLDGTMYVTGHHDGLLRLWDRASGKLLQALPGHRLPVYALAYSRDGKSLVSGGGISSAHRREGELLLWDTATWKSRPLSRQLPAAVNSLAFSADGRTAAAALGMEVQLWELPSETLRKSLSLGAPAASLAFHSNNATLAAGLDDGRIALCEAADGRVLKSWPAHPSIVRSVAYSPTNDLIVSGGHDDSVRLWDRGTNRLLGEYRHDSPVWSVAFSPDAHTVASISEDGIVKLWDVNARRERFLLAMPPGFGRCVAFSPDSEELVVAQHEKLWICDVSRSTEATSWLGHRLGALPREAWAVAFSPDGKTLASAGDDYLIHLWDPASGRNLNSFRGHQSLVTCLAFSPDGKWLASGSFEKGANVKLWSATTGEEVVSLPGHTKPVDALVFAPDGKSLATAGRDGIVRMWDLSTRKDRLILSGHRIESLAFSPDGRTLALAGEQESLFFLWDVEEGRMRWDLSIHPKGHVAVAFSPDGKMLSTGDKDGVVCLFDAVTGQLHNKFQSRGHMVNCLAFSPDGKTLASAGFDKKVKLWQVSTGRELLTLPEQKDRVRWLAFSPDGAMLATAGHDGVLTIYRAHKTEPPP